jgi:hypothetical protein
MKWLMCLMTFVLVPACMGQWELGVLGGYGFPTEVNVEGSAGSGKTGFAHGATFGVLAGDNMYRYVGAEVRYLYRMNDMKLKASGADVKFAAHSHLVHFDLLFHTAPKESRVRPFFAGGAGVRVYQGTGTESSYQPGNALVVLTHTRETTPLATAGGGVKVKASDRFMIRAEVRDYISPVPTKMITPMRDSKLGSWFHDIVPMVAFEFTF